MAELVFLALGVAHLGSVMVIVERFGGRGILIDFLPALSECNACKWCRSQAGGAHQQEAAATRARPVGLVRHDVSSFRQKSPVPAGAPLAKSHHYPDGITRSAGLLTFVHERTD